MLPLLGDDQRKNINLGGSSSGLSQAAILAQAKVRRLEREKMRKQQSAVKIGNWWRAISTGRRVRREILPVAERAIRESKDGKVGLEVLRSVVFIGGERVLALWAGTVVLNVDGGHMF